MLDITIISTMEYVTRYAEGILRTGTVVTWKLYDARALISVGSGGGGEVVKGRIESDP